VARLPAARCDRRNCSHLPAQREARNCERLRRRLSRPKLLFEASGKLEPSAILIRSSPSSKASAARVLRWRASLGLPAGRREAMGSRVHNPEVMKLLPAMVEPDFDADSDRRARMTANA
jgi:hypothetical protein